MEKSKFWVWFIPLFIVVSIGLYVSISIADSVSTVETISDSQIIKEKYESLNNSEEYLEVKLSKDNTFKFISSDELKDMLDNKQGIIFLGNYEDNVSRRVVTILDSAVSSTSIEYTYYYDYSNVSDDIKNYLMDKLNMKEVKSGTVITFKDGSILSKYYPKTDDEDKLLEEYQKDIMVLVDACDESC